MSGENTFLKEGLAENFMLYGVPKDTIEPLVTEVSTCIDTKGNKVKLLK